MEHIIWNADPVLFAYGSFKIHWYGLLFAGAILVGLEIMKLIYKREKLSLDSVDTGFMYIFIGIVVGARLGHCLFYDPVYYLSNPFKILAVWEGGLASHGGGLGALIGSYLYTKKEDINYMWFLDRIAISTALFAFSVRMGNLMNSEIVGIPTDSPWGIVFSKVDLLPRHPTQVYEAISYLIIFFILIAIYLYTKKRENQGFMFGVFLLLVFSARFIIEFFKEHQAAYESILYMNTGQMLSIPFLLLSLWLIKNSLKKVNS